MSKPPPAAILTVFTKDRETGPLSKTISLAPDGTGLNSDASACAMWKGEAERFPVTDLDAFAALISQMPSGQAIGLGRMDARAPARVRITTVARRGKGAVPRTAEHFAYHREPGLGLLDLDLKSMPKAAEANLAAHGGLWGAVCHVAPGMSGGGRIERKSTSAGIEDTRTGHLFQASGGLHLYVHVLDMTDWPRALRALHGRLWLAGMGWYTVSRSGALLERSLVDVAVAAPERLVFEGAPVVVEPLRQDAALRAAIVHRGDAVDTRAAVPDLTAREQHEVEAIKRKAREAIKPEAAKVRAVYLDEVAADIESRLRVPRSVAREMAERHADGVLLPHAALHFDDPAIGKVSVRDILIDPDRYVEETLADPLEGVAYGRTKAKVFRRESGEVWIRSFAHGGMRYELRFDEQAVRDVVAAVASATKVRTFCDAVARSELMETTTEVLKRELIVSQRLSTARALNADLKAARERHAAARPKRGVGDEADTRPIQPAPQPDGELTPVMFLLDQVLGAVDALEPPMRDSEHWLVDLRSRSIPSRHRLTEAGGDNEEAEEDRLPPPEFLTLSRLDTPQVQELVEAHLRLLRTTRNGSWFVRLPAPFANAYRAWQRSSLPQVAHIITAPLVLRDGSLLSGVGLDRSLGLLFRIPTALRDSLPRASDVTEQDVVEAVRFLTEEWLGDCLTTFTGKMTLVTLALTVMQRALLPMRPMFFATAGQRGSGKTTALVMVIAAATGREPPAAAWSDNVEERRKAFHAYLMEALPALVVDNLPRGLIVDCPHLAKLSTSESSTDRVLGFSRTAVVSNATVICFSGNNCAPGGDMASRSLAIRFVTDRPDPEDRRVAHADPVQWTLDNRLRIARALYTVLLAGKFADADGHLAGRFKVWSELIGRPVETAARLAARAAEAVLGAEIAAVAVVEAEELLGVARDLGSGDVPDRLAALEVACLAAAAAAEVAVPWRRVGVAMAAVPLSFGEMLKDNEDNDAESDAAASAMEVIGSAMGFGRGNGFTAARLADLMNGAETPDGRRMDGDAILALEEALKTASVIRNIRRVVGGTQRVNATLLGRALDAIKDRVASASAGRVLALKHYKPAGVSARRTATTWWIEEGQSESGPAITA